jgi:hypothetical protein
MTVVQYRFLLIASIVLGLFSGIVDPVFPALLPEELYQAQRDYGDTLPEWRILFLAGWSIVYLILSIAAWYGFYRLRPWAPRLAILATFLGYPLYLVSGAFVQSGMASTLASLSLCLWGAVIVPGHAYSSNARFLRSDG